MGGSATAAVVDGTSFSIPMTAAAVALLVYDVYVDLGYDLSDIAYRGITFYTMYMNAEGVSNGKAVQTIAD